MTTKSVIPRRSFGQRVVRDWKRYWLVYLIGFLCLSYYFIFCYLPMGGIVIAFKNFRPARGIWGSKYLAKQLKKQGCNYSIWRFNGLAHEVASYMQVAWNIEKAFLEKNVIQGIPCAVDALVDDPSLPRWKSWAAKAKDLYQ